MNRQSKIVFVAFATVFCALIWGIPYSEEETRADTLTTEQHALCEHGYEVCLVDSTDRDTMSRFMSRYGVLVPDADPLHDLGSATAPSPWSRFTVLAEAGTIDTTRVLTTTDTVLVIRDGTRLRVEQWPIMRVRLGGYPISMEGR